MSENQNASAERPESRFRKRSSRSSFSAAAMASLALGASLIAPPASPAVAQTHAATPATAAAPAEPPGVPYPADQVSRLLPPSVYFQGKTANLQLRNAGAVRFAGGAVTWVALVDSTGYASDVQERYQFYFVTEAPLDFGGATLPAGAYGGGFLPDGFLLMDIGGHTVAHGPIEADPAFPRPRPLQLQPDGPNSVKLYLGRRWVRLRATGSR